MIEVEVARIPGSADRGRRMHRVRPHPSPRTRVRSPRQCPGRRAFASAALVLGTLACSTAAPPASPPASAPAAPTVVADGERLRRRVRRRAAPPSPPSRGSPTPRLRSANCAGSRRCRTRRDRACSRPRSSRRRASRRSRAQPSTATSPRRSARTRTWCRGPVPAARTASTSTSGRPTSAARSLLPVMVWIHGGANANGTATAAQHRRREPRAQGRRGRVHQLPPQPVRLPRPPGADRGVRARLVGQLRAARPDRGAAVGAAERRRVRRGPGPGDGVRRVGRRHQHHLPAGVAPLARALPPRRDRERRLRGGRLPHARARRRRSARTSRRRSAWRARTTSSRPCAPPPPRISAAPGSASGSSASTRPTWTAGCSRRRPRGRSTGASSTRCR